MIMADQLAPQFTGTYGHPIVQIPNLDALAARGMRFDAAYCSSPLCAPARFAFMAGQLVTKIGAYDNAAEFPASIPAFAAEVRERWGSAQIRADVLASQRMRRAVHAGMSVGRRATGTIRRGAMLPRSTSATTWIGPWLRRPPGSHRSPAQPAGAELSA